MAKKVKAASEKGLTINPDMEGKLLKEIFTVSSSAPEAEQMQLVAGAKDLMNRHRWANYYGRMVDYPQGQVPSFRYTPAMLESLKAKGIDKNYIESYNPSNYMSNVSVQDLADGGIVDYRRDPSLDMNSGVSADIISATLQGLATSGPAGAGAALLTSGLKSLMQRDQRMEAKDQVHEDWARFWGTRSAQNTAASGYAEGGKIKGKGTGKSDSIGMKAPEGSFIVPKENAAQAMAYGADYLGWGDNEIAKRNYGNVDINVSNGEVFYTPDEYDALNYYGVDVDALAPEAEKNKTGFCRGGKMKKGYSDGGVTIADVEKQNQERLERDISNPLNSYIADSMAAIQKELEGQSLPTVSKVSPAALPENDKNKFPWAEVASGIQMAAGAAGLAEAGKRPDINVSKALERISRETREEAGYGLPPSVKNEMKKDQERAFRQTTKMIGSRGGSAQEMHNESIAALSALLSAQGKTHLMDYQEQERKKDRNIAIEKLIGAQEFDIDKIGLASWERDQDVWGSLLSAGIENIIGARQYANEAEIMKEIQKSRQIPFTPPRTQTT
jgi:hypothetical protein